jgi:dTDP-4-amino-4,6-dideoxygalactose transaminase
MILSSKVDKTKFTKLLKEKFGVETGTVFYPPCHMQTIYQKLAGFKPLPVAERVLSQTITLPMHVELSETDVTHVVKSVQSALDTTE